MTARAALARVEANYEQFRRDGRLPATFEVIYGHAWVPAPRVTVDGRLVCSCLMLGVEAEGRELETVEGLANGTELHPLQTKFLEHAALQCGVCTPGFLMAAKALLEKNPDPSEEEIRFGLAGNLCRCTGYDKIVRAVQDAAKVMRG